MAFGDLKGTLTGSGASVTNPSDISGSVVVAVGDLVFAVFGEQTALTATGATDNLGNTYSAQNAGTLSGTISGRAFYSRITVAGTLTVVHIAATASANDFAGFAAVIEGPFAASPLDANPANVSDVFSPFVCPLSGTLSQASEVVMNWGAAGGTSVVWAAVSPSILAGNANSSTLAKVALSYRVATTTASSTPSFTAASNPTDDTLGTASFKAVVATVAPPPFARPIRFYNRRF